MMMTQSNPDMDVIDVAPLIMKGIERIEAINTPSEERVEAHFSTWQICRVFRRDFNKFTAKMFITSRRPGNLQKIRSMLFDITDEAESLGNMARRYEMPVDLPSTDIPLRLVSDEAKLLFEAFITVDKAVAKMLNSEMHEIALDNCYPFFKAYGRLKRFIFKGSIKAVGQNNYALSIQ